MISVRPTLDQALVKPRPDLHERLVTGISLTGGVIETEFWGRVHVGDVKKYENTQKRNSFAFGEIVAIGEGTAFGQGMDVPDLKKGDIVGYDMAQVSHATPIGGVGVNIIVWRQLLCKWDLNDTLPKPLMNHVMTVEDPDLMNAVFYSEIVHLMSDTEEHKGIASASDMEFSASRLTAERIVGIGPGRFVKGTFVSAKCSVGDGAIFMPNRSVDLEGFGKRYRFTPWGEVQLVVTFDDEEASEAAA